MRFRACVGVGVVLAALCGCDDGRVDVSVMTVDESVAASQGWKTENVFISYYPCRLVIDDLSVSMYRETAAGTPGELLAGFTQAGYSAREAASSQEELSTDVLSREIAGVTAYGFHWDYGYEDGYCWYLEKNGDVYTVAIKGDVSYVDKEVLAILDELEWTTASYSEESARIRGLVPHKD